MVELGIRVPKWYPVFIEYSDKKLLRTERHKHKGENSGYWAGPIKHIPFYNKLIVYTTSSEKTTYSHTCGQSDIPRILEMHERTSEVLKYSWNGKTYNKATLPTYYRG